MQKNKALISVETLTELRTNQRLILLDASIAPIGTKPEDVVKETIPGAIFFDIEKEFSDSTNPLPHTLISPELFEQKSKTLGINQDSILVVFDGYGIYSAARAWWMFKVMGHEQVYVLNGGLPAWKRAGKEATTHFTIPKTQGNFRTNFQPQLLSTKEEIKRQLDNPLVSIVDARSAARFFAQVEEPRAGLRKGHIPHSKNIPFVTCIENGFLKNTNALKDLVKPIVENENTHCVFSCGSGITACIPLLVFYELGYRNLALYDGSWAEWGADAAYPVSEK